MPQLERGELDQYKQMVKALCDLEEGLSQWEADFADDMSTKVLTGYLSEKQMTKIVQLYEEHCL